MRNAARRPSAALAALALLTAIRSFAAPPSAADDAPSLDQLEQARLASLVAAGFVRGTLGDAPEELVYFAAGTGQPLIFLHGVGNRASVWFDVAPAFTGSYRVIVPDLPGHGESAPREGDLPMATIVGGTERLLAAVTADRPAILVGNSMGAWIATLLAHRHPGRVDRIVLVDGGPLPGEPGAPSLLPTTREEAARLMAMLRDPSAPPLPDWLLDDLVRRAPGAPTARLLRDLPGLVAHLLVGRLGEVHTPVDLLWGASDQLMKLSSAERLREQFPAARLTPIEECGHIPELECPRDFTRLLTGILAAPPPTATPDTTPPAAR